MPGAPKPMGPLFPQRSLVSTADASICPGFPTPSGSPMSWSFTKSLTIANMLPKMPLVQNRVEIRKQLIKNKPKQDGRRRSVQPERLRRRRRSVQPQRFRRRRRSVLGTTGSPSSPHAFFFPHKPILLPPCIPHWNVCLFAAENIFFLFFFLAPEPSLPFLVSRCCK